MTKLCTHTMRFSLLFLPKNRKSIAETKSEKIESGKKVERQIHTVPVTGKCNKIMNITIHV